MPVSQDRVLGTDSSRSGGPVRRRPARRAARTPPRPSKRRLATWRAGRPASAGALDRAGTATPATPATARTGRRGALRRRRSPDHDPARWPVPRTDRTPGTTGSCAARCRPDRLRTLERGSLVWLPARDASVRTSSGFSPCSRLRVRLRPRGRGLVTATDHEAWGCGTHHRWRQPLHRGGASLDADGPAIRSDLRARSASGTGATRSRPTTAAEPSLSGVSWSRGVPAWSRPRSPPSGVLGEVAAP